MPTDYFLAAMASRYALALAWAAGKRGISLPGLAVVLTAGEGYGVLAGAGVGWYDG